MSALSRQPRLGCDSDPLGREAVCCDRPAPWLCAALVPCRRKSEVTLTLPLTLSTS